MSDFEIPIGSLEEQALKRKERLKNLKRKIQTKETEPKQSTDTEKIVLPPPTKLTKNIPIEDASENNQIQPKNDDVINMITNEIETLKTPIVIDEIDIANLAPRKPDWDLKRDVAKKLEILERRTQRAISELIRDRLRSNQGDLDLNAINTIGYSIQSKKEL
ncbi:coiled-coil domain-containing protein 12 [Contarinia nasturtii]|uniref:coiled-coil domain-containing protein 12 n=1 Tax=Contarinia nasturtii TaxID=265458 RepID=UPI0012D44FF0|nr:coiled-coil domain-containing protein 12 [Contarinia nasturtii]